MDITFNYQNWLSRYFAWVFGVNPPNWLCPFFWLIIFLVVLSPIIVYLCKRIPKRKSTKVEKPKTDEQYERKRKKERIFMKVATFIGKAIFACLLAFYAGIIVYVLYLSIMAYDLHDWLMGALMIIGAITVIGGVIWLLIRGLTSYTVRNAANTVGHLIGMAYHKVCPHITWTGTPPIQPKAHDEYYDY